jgi:hypothetical protein
MASAVFCIADDQRQATRIAERLRDAGFTGDDISLLLPDRAGPHDFAHEQASKAPEGATAGGTAGGLLGGAVGWLVGIGSLAIPGLGPLVAAGPIMAALSAAAAGAAIGGLTGALVGMGIPEYEAKLYEGRVRGGNILIAVHAADAERRAVAEGILVREGARDINVSGLAAAPDS